MCLAFGAVHLRWWPVNLHRLAHFGPSGQSKSWEYDDSLPEPDWDLWVKISLTVQRTDSGVVDAELLRPRQWADALGLAAGRLLPIDIQELQVQGTALIKAIEPCPLIAAGEGSPVTARFVTRQVDTIVRIEVLGADGQVETIEGTTIHPIWSEDRQDCCGGSFWYSVQ